MVDEVPVQAPKEPQEVTLTPLSIHQVRVKHRGSRLVKDGQGYDSSII